MYIFSPCILEQIVLLIHSFLLQDNRSRKLLLPNFRFFSSSSSLSAQIMRPLACCHRSKGISVDFEDEHNRVMTYNGLETCIRNSFSCDNESVESGADGCVTTDSLDGEVSSCLSSTSKEACGSSSFSSQWLLSNSKLGYDQVCVEDWDVPSGSGLQLCSKGKLPAYTMRFSDVETMKEKFAKLLLGDDISGGCTGVTTALALSHAITNLAASVFGELWKLEPLSEEKKSRWRREMDWLLSPTNYMVELVPTKQNGVNGCMLEIMTPKARSDVHTSLPALRKLDSMLIEVLDSMIDTEFWYAEGGSRIEGRTQGVNVKLKKKWWLPSPRVPESGLSVAQRKRLGFQGKFVHQVMKAAKSINEHVLLQMPVHASMKDAFPKTGKAILGEDICRAISSESTSNEEILGMFNLKSEHSVLETVNRLEGAVFAWKQKLSNALTRKSPVRKSLVFMWDVVDKMELSLERAETLLQLLKLRFPNLPQTFLDGTRVRYNKDVGHSIIEAYSRVLGSLAFSILSRIGDILQEDDLNKPSTPVATLKFDVLSDVYLAGITETPPGHIKRSLVEQMNKVDGRISTATKDLEEKISDTKKKTVMAVGMRPHRNLLLW